MLFSERKRLRDLEKREALGEKVWSGHVPAPLRNKFRNTIKNYGWVANEYDKSYGVDKIVELAAAIMANERGEDEPALMSYINYCDEDDFPDVIESVALAIRYYEKENDAKGALEGFGKDINGLLESYRLNYSLEGVQVIEFESRETHKSIVGPTLMLISKKGWSEVEEAYQNSLKELAAGNPSDAITDATTALQEALRKLGCKGDDLGTLLKSAKNTVLKGFDSKYVEAIENLIKWTSASRAKRGDSHKVTKADREDAWLVVHTVGILILRLSAKK